MIFEIDEKKSIKIEEYNGNYSLTAVYNGRPSWAKYQTGYDKYSEKASPVKVDLGNKATAILTLTAIANWISGGNKDDAPF